MRRFVYYEHPFYGYDRGWHGGGRARRGDMGPIILKLLEDKPMHGYEIISRLEEKSHGMWRPSAGSIYPTLQLLEEQELVASEEKDGKKVYSLTDKGKEAAKDSEAKAPWEEKVKHAKQFKEFKGSLFEIMGLFKEILSQDSEEKSKELKQALEGFKSKLSDIAEKDSKS